MLNKLGYNFILNTAAVRSIEEAVAHPASGRERCEVIFADGSHKLLDIPFDRIERVAGAVVPAPPGYMIMEALAPEPECGRSEAVFTTWPVLAFRLTDAEPMPIGPLGEPSSDWTWALVYPDGRADSRWDQVYPTEAFQAEFRANHPPVDRKDAA